MFLILIDKNDSVNKQQVYLINEGAHNFGEWQYQTMQALLVANFPKEVIIKAQNENWRVRNVI